MPNGHESLFLKSPTLPTRGFESGASTTPDQKARAADLFVRGALTAEDYAKARASGSGFEAVVGRSNFLPAVFLETGVAAGRCTCLVRASGVDFRGNTGAWTGTGFLIGPNVLLTNNHVLNSEAVARAGSCVFNFQAGLDGSQLATTAFRLRPERLFLTSPAIGGLDYTFVWVEGEPAAQFGTVRVSRQAFAIAVKEFANVISHPDGRPKEVCLQENEVFWQDDLVVHYSSDTEPGSSGAAVCNNGWQLVALHHASKDSNVAGGPRILNEGIKVSAIVADLERRARAGESAARELLPLFGGVDERLGFFGRLGRGRPEGAGLEAVRNTFQGDEQDIDVGFWNVEWLSDRYPEKVPAVAKAINDFNLDVWCLEESSPSAVEALVKELKETYGQDYGAAAAEPDAPDSKQSCTLLWNTATVSCEKRPWGQPIDSWLRVNSRDFDDLDLGGFEAVHGKVFDRFPALFHCRAVQPAGGRQLEFHLVGVHLKAKGEGSLRRRMASKILAAAVRKKVDEGAGLDWVIGGDFNAELATGDFDDLIGGDMTPVSAEDEQGGAFSYIKGPKSLIDHVFLSPNLAERYGANDFVIVAAEKTIPDYVAQVSDHRPVLLRMSLGGVAESRPTGGLESGENLSELKGLLAQVRADATAQEDDFEARRRGKRRRDRQRHRPHVTVTGGGGLGGRAGYDPDFLGDGTRVPLPGLPAELAGQAAVVDRSADGLAQFVLCYQHFSVVQNAARRLPFYSAVNIDGTQLRRIARGDDWQLDPRIPASAQVGNEAYRNNDLDRGHMTRRLDPVWGPPDVASRANDDTFYYTNSCPQHKDLNQKEWNDLEDYVLDNAGAERLQVSVFTGPVFGEQDREYRGIVRIPEEFWKVVVMVREATGSLSATGYVLSQRDMLNRGFEADFRFGPFRTYQVPVRSIARLTGLDFGRLPEFDPKDRPGLEAAGGVTLVTGPESLVI